MEVCDPMSTNNLAPSLQKGVKAYVHDMEKLLVSENCFLYFFYFSL